MALAGFGVLGTATAQAHDWYPLDCCHDQDCAPVDKLEQVPTQKLAHAGMAFAPNLRLPSQMLVTTKHGTVLVPENFPRRASHDGQWHACIQSSGSVAPARLICLFEPPAM